MDKIEYIKGQIEDRESTIKMYRDSAEEADSKYIGKKLESERSNLLRYIAETDIDIEAYQLILNIELMKEEQGKSNLEETI